MRDSVSTVESAMRQRDAEVLDAMTSQWAAANEVSDGCFG